MAKAYVPPIRSKVSPARETYEANWERTFGKKPRRSAHAKPGEKCLSKP